MEFYTINPSILSTLRICFLCFYMFLKETCDEGAEGENQPEHAEQEPGQDGLGDLQQPQHGGHRAGLQRHVDCITNFAFNLYLL